jgi:hypothetical protein
MNITILKPIENWNVVIHLYRITTFWDSVCNLFGVPVYEPQMPFTWLPRNWIFLWVR